MIVQADRKRRGPPDPGSPVGGAALAAARRWVSSEAIHESLYARSRGALKRELTRPLSTGRSLRKVGRMAGQRKNRIPDMVNIAGRLAEAADRA